MSSFIQRDVLGYGFLLWLAGYLLGFDFYALVPSGSHWLVRHANRYRTDLRRPMEVVSS